MKKALLVAALAFATSTQVLGVEHYYLGAFIGQGYVSSNTGSSALTHGAELGVGVNHVLDLVVRATYQPHKNASNDLKMWMASVSADYLLADLNDIYLSVGAGPGLYGLFDYPKDMGTKFGLNAEAFADVVLDSVRVGVGYRYHFLRWFDSASSANISQVMMRVGYTFGG